MEDRQKEARKREEEERMRLEREEEEKHLKWKKELGKFETNMGSRLEKKLDELGASIKGKGAVDVPTSNDSEDELAKLRREGCDLKDKINALLNHPGEDKVLYLQQEILDLRKQVTSKQTSEDAILALKLEMDDLKRMNSSKRDLEKAVTNLRSNKRGSVAVNTPGEPPRGAPKPRWTDNIRDTDEWREEYRNLRNLHQLANVEAEALKKKRTEAEAKRMEAELQVKKLEERMSKLSASGEKDRRGGGTNLKERMEEAALRSARKGVKATSGRFGGKSPEADASTQDAAEVNDRTGFVKGEKKKLRMLRKAGLEPLCKEADIKLDRFEDIICELAEYRAKLRFGSSSTDGGGAKEACSVVEVEEDSSKDTRGEGSDGVRSVEL
ncbi:hypothetical protein CBR_g106 [Chara braunii]|uniref:Uncharacterized protein n=1 Tax=Chara braunii TaxID=69332 RepID=A0A388JLU5_CHABU|nr:hypothetical protein CBR_g106 [Chara braunii]|eukprot:GBG58705.1 hypothetical protein CBR_g106 [Chara braunii]